MSNIKNFNKFVLENVETLNLVTIRKNILSLRGKSEGSISEILPGFELENFDGDPQDRAYCDLVSPADKDNVVHVVAKLEFEDGIITVVNKMDDKEINEWLENKL